MMPADLATRCANHPQVVSVATCDGCGSVVYADCRVSCVRCAAPSSKKRPLIALALGVLAVPVWFTASMSPAGFMFGLPASMMLAALGFLVILGEWRERKLRPKRVPDLLYVAVWFLALFEVLFGLGLGYGIIVHP
jgi:hypothetical protein